jgi:hypothetical protein
MSSLAYEVKCLFMWADPSLVFEPVTVFVISAKSPYTSNCGLRYSFRLGGWFDCSFGAGASCDFIRISLCQSCASPNSQLFKASGRNAPRSSSELLGTDGTLPGFTYPSRSGEGTSRGNPDARTR